MRIAVIGAGGVGGYFGAKLAQGGHDVAFVARGAHLAAMKRAGLRVESAGGDIALERVAATDDAASLGTVDVVMLCVKLWDVERAAPQIAPLVARGGVVIPFQNGIDAPDILVRALGPAHVLGGVAYIAASIRAPGVIEHVGSMARLAIGAFDAALEPRAQAFVDACRSAGIDAQLAPDVRRTIWEKFVFLAALSGITCLARQPVGGIRGDADLRTAFESAVREIVAVAGTRGVAFDEAFIGAQMRFLDGLPAAMRSSMLNDLTSGRRLEAPWLAGRVVALAREAGLAAPVNATIYAALKPYLNGAPQ